MTRRSRLCLGVGRRDSQANSQRDWQGRLPRSCGFFGEFMTDTPRRPWDSEAPKTMLLDGLGEQGWKTSAVTAGGASSWPRAKSLVWGKDFLVLGRDRSRIAGY
jgi:hypothetical protein